jgi:hypothetical protein
MKQRAAKLRTGNVPGIYHATIWICYLGAIDRYCPTYAGRAVTAPVCARAQSRVAPAR